MERMPIRNRYSLTYSAGAKEVLCGIRPDFSGLSPCYGQVAYVLLTRAPVASKSIATSLLPLDLHVLSL